MSKYSYVHNEGKPNQPTLVSRRLNECVILYTERYLNSLCAEKIEEECDSIIKRGVKKIIINFKNTELVNSIGISVLISIIEKLKSIDGVLYFTNLTKTNYDTFHMLGLTKFVLVHQTEEKALSHIGVAS